MDLYKKNTNRYYTTNNHFLNFYMLYEKTKIKNLRIYKHCKIYPFDYGNRIRSNTEFSFCDTTESTQESTTE